MKLIFENYWKICLENSILTRKTSTLHEEDYMDLISRSVLITMRNVREICREIQNAHFIINTFFKKKSCCL